MVHLSDPLISPYSAEFDKYDNKDFLGVHIEDEIMQKIARGEAHPDTKLDFRNDENEKYIVNRALKNKNQPMQLKSAKDFRDRDRGKSHEHIPKFFKQPNIDPKYMDLWKQHPNMFWREYWKDRKLGLNKGDPYKDHGATRFFEKS